MSHQLFGYICLVCFYLCIVAIISNYQSRFSYAADDNLTRDLIYGCQKYGAATHCDRIPNDLLVQSFAANSSKVITSLDEPKILTGKISGALKMEAPFTESVDIPHLVAYNLTRFSVSFWVKSDSVSEPYGYVASYTTNPPHAGWYFDAYSNSNGSKSFIRFNVPNTANKVFSSSDILVPRNDFINIVGTFNGSSLVAYANGKPVSQTKFIGKYDGDPKTPIKIGSGSWCGACRTWSGTMDDFRLYNRTLSSKEVGNIYIHGNLSNNEPEKGLISYFPFDNGLQDHSENKNNGKLLSIISGIAVSPDGRVFFAQKDTGQILIMKNSQILEKPFVTIKDQYVSWEQGLLGITLDPHFGDNHFLYLYYTSSDKATGEIFNRVVRFTDKDNRGVDEVVLLDKIFAEKGYNSGGALAFGPDDKLYVSAGDAGEHPFAQDLSIEIGKVLRINRDGSIPSDNPFPGSPIYTYGHRNVFGIAFDKNGNGIVTENGEAHYDEVNLLQKGGNYGFPLLQKPNEPPELSNSSNYIKPLRSYWNSIVPTQSIYYNGTKFPEINGMFLFGTYAGNIYALKLNNKTKQINSETILRLDTHPVMPVVSLAESPTGDIYFAGYTIEKLDSIIKGSRIRAINSVFINLPRTFDMVDLKGNEIQRTLDLSINRISNATNNQNFVTIKIPTALLTDVYKVTQASKNPESISQNREIKFNVEESTPDYTVLKIPLVNEKYQDIFIVGT